MNSEVKRRVLILSIGIIGMISLITGISFAAFSINLNGTKQNAISTGCLKVEMSDNGNLAIENAYPVTDEEGLASDAYTYTIENTCTVNAYYEATLNAMEGTTLANLKKVKVALSGDSYLKPTFEDDLDSSTLLNNDSDVLRTYRLDEGYIAAGETKTFNLRTWIDYDVEQISGKIENKVIIQSEARTNNTLVYNTKTIGYFSGSREQLLKNVDYKQISSESGIVESKNNTETSYYFRGTPTNTVVFGTYNSSFNGHSSGDSIRWKILNTNSDGSVNLITEESIGNSTYSNVQNLLTSFYNTHLQDEETYIKTNSTFCKEGATSGEYLAKLRTESNNPTSKCNGNSTFTKIGLPTVDDLMYAGAVLDKANTSYYLYNGNSFMTGTSSSASTIYASNASKSIYEASTSTSLGVRPVITIKKDTLLSGNGTTETPYYVSGTYETPSTSKDTNKPVIVYARVEEKWSKTNKQIEISAKDNNTIAGYIVKTTSAAPNANDSGWEAATSNKYKTVNAFDNGTYYVFAKDAAGNVSDPEQVKVERVDKVAPTCTIRLNSTPDSTIYKTLTVISEDTNIDLKGYSWDDDEEIKTSTRKIGQNGVYKAYLKDLAGNTGSCQITVTSVTEFYTVIYKANGGVGEDKEDRAPVGGEYTLLKNTFTRSGYSFIGWDTNKDATEPTYSDKQEVTSLATSGNTITLYAIWDRNTIEFDDKNIETTYSTSEQTKTNAIDEASNGTGSYTYAITGGNTNNYFSVTGRNIKIKENTPAGTYNVKITATDSGTGVTKEATYTIKVNKAASTLSLNPTSLTLTYGTNGTSTITKTGDGTLSCTTSDSAVATCSVSGTTLTVVPKANTSDGKTATITVKLSAGTNYNAAQDKTVSVTVNRKTLTCPSSPSDKTYNGEEQASGISCPTGSTSGGDTAKTNAGNYSQTCTASSGYKFANTCSVSWKINKKAITIKAKDQSVAYGTAISKTTNDVTISSGSLVSGHTLEGITLSQSKTAVSTDGKITASNAVIKSGSNTVTTNYDITYTQGNLTITKKNITASIGSCSNKTYDGSDTATCTINLTGVASGETATASATCKFNNATAGDNKQITCNALTLSGTHKDNYNLTTTSLTGTANISKASVTCSASAGNYSYRGTVSTPSVSSNPGNGTVTYYYNSTNSTSGGGAWSNLTNTTLSPNTYYVYATIPATTNYKSATCTTGSFTVNKGTCEAPTNIAVATDKKVSWTNSGAATGYQISMSSNTGFEGHTNGSAYSKITEEAGARTVYVRSVCDTDYYSSGYSSNATKAVTVYSVALTKGTGIASVTGAGNYISGATVSINATVSEGYTWSKWTQTSGGAQVSTTKAYSAAINSNWAYTANTTNSQYTITYKDCGDSAFSGTHANTYPTSYTYGTGATLDSPTKTNYTFAGYYSTSTCSGTKVTSIGTSETGNKTYYAKWLTNIQAPTAANYCNTLTYNGSDQTLVKTAGTGFTWDSTTTSGKNASNYTVKANVASGYAWSDGTTGAKTISCSIGKRTVTVTAPTPISSTLTYTGSGQNLLSAVGSCSTGGTMYWYSSNPSTSSSAPSFSTSTFTTTAPTTSSYKGTNAGTYYIYYYCKVDDTDNNTGSNINTVKSVTKAIGQKADTITITNQTKTYNGSTQSTVASATSGLTPSVTYYTNNTCSTKTTSSNSGASSEGGAPKNVGTYYVTATTAGNTNYSAGSKSCTEAITISKYTPTLATSVTTGSVNYNSTNTFTATPTTISACQGTLTAASANTSYVSITGGASNSNVTSGTAKTITYKGVAYTTGTNINVNYTPTDTTNCNSATQKTVSISVARIAQTVTFSDITKTYNGSAQAASGATTNGDGTISYKYYTNNSCTTGETTTAPTNAGTYYVKATAAQTSHYNEGSKCVKYTMNQRTVTVTAPTPVSSTLTYTGSGQNLLSAVGSCTTGGTMYWYSSNPSTSSSTPSFSTSTFTTTAPTTSSYKGTNAGTYYIYYYCKVDDTDNNTGSNINTVKSVTKTIGQKADTITITNQTKTYNGSTQSTVASATSGLTPSVTYYTNNTCSTKTTLSNSGASSEGGAPKNVGTYYVTATTAGNTNYSAGSKSCTEAITISKYTPTLATSVTTGSVNYNSTNTFTATPTTISACQGTLTAASANTSYVTVSTSSNGTYAATASKDNVTNSSQISFYYKGTGYTTGTNIAVSYTPSDTNNCNSATTKTIAITVNKATATNSVKITGTNTWGSTLTATITTNSNGTKGYKWYYSSTAGATSGGTAVNDTNCNAGSTCVIPQSLVGKYIYVVGSVGDSTNYTTPSNSVDATDASTNTTQAVAKKAVSCSTSKGNYAYNGTIGNPSVSSNPGSGTVTYYRNTSNSTSGGTAWSGTTSTTLAPNTYYIYATIGETTLYKSATCTTGSFTVSKGTLAVTKTAYNAAYDGSEHYAKVKVTSTNWDGKTIVSGTSTSYGTTVTSTGAVNTDYNLKPGYTDYASSARTVYFKVTGGTYYNDYTDSSTVTISKKTATNSVKITGTNTWGSTLTATITTNSNGTKGYKWYYSSTAGATSGGTAVNDTNCNAGSTCVIPQSLVGKYIYVVGSVGDSTNYTTPSNSVDATDASTNTTQAVAKKAVSCSTSKGNYAYNGTIGSPSVSTNPGSGTVTYYRNTSNSTSGGTAWSGTTSTTLAPNTYYIYATIGETTLYKSATCTTGSFTVSKGTLAVTKTAYNAAYDGSEHYAKVKVTSTNWDGKTIVSGTSTSYGTTVTSTGAVNTDYNLKPGYTDYASSARTVYFKVTGGTYYNDYTDSSTVTITKGTCTAPTNVTIGTDKKVSWTAASGATSYQVCVASGSSTCTPSTTLTSGSVYNAITDATGSRTVYVRSVCDTTNYSSQYSSNASKAVTVYSVALTKGTGISAVSGAGNYISGANVSIDATVSNGYTWSKWTQTSGGSQVSTTKAYSAAISSNWAYTANATINSYELTINPNGGSISGKTTSYTVTQDYNTKIAVPKPTRTGYTFDGWTTSGSGSLSKYGKGLYNDDGFNSGNNSMSIYNNSSNGNVTHARIATTSDNPMKDSSYIIQIKTAGTASPGLGGFVQSTSSRENAVFYHVVVAKIPTGYSIEHAQNATGNGRIIEWLTPTAGTGEYETYIYKHTCGSGGTFSTFGHLYLTGTAATASNPVTWYVAYANMFDYTSEPDAEDGQVFTYGTGNMTLTAKWKANPLTFANQSISKTFSTSAQTASITGASNGTGTYTYTEVSEKKGNTNTDYLSISGTTINIAANTPAGTYTYVIKAKDSNSGAEKEATYTVTIGAQKCATPTNIQVSTAGRVSWTSSSTSACSTHQVKVGTGSYATATSGVDKNSDITSATGSRSVSVIAKAPNSNYTDSDAASKSVTVYAITFASNDRDKGTVSPTSKNVISGATVTTSGNNLLIQGVTSGTTTTTLATITPTPKTGYKYSSWSKTSGSLTSTQTIAATFIEDAYIATFYYQSNTTNGTTNVSSTTAQCNVTSGTSCTATIPTAVRNSGGTYNNAYAGLRTAAGANMSPTVAKNATTVTLSANTDYYSLYSTEIKIYYPSSVSATTSKSTYQNQWFTSKTAMGTTVLSSSSTGTTTNATAATAVSGYTTLVGFSASNSTNTATWSTIASLTQSDSSRNASRSVYEIDKKTVTATFYYYSGSAQTSKTASGDQYLRCKSTSTAEIYDSDISVPTEVTSSTGPNSSPYSGLSTSTSSTTTTTTINTSVLNYYAIYGSSYTATFVKENSNVQAIGSTSLSCSNTYTTNGTSYSASGSGEDCTIIMPSITPITGYKSIGWYDSDGNWFNYSNSEITLTSNATFTAKVKRLTADEMYYDNTNSGVECDNAQCMIDYLDTDNNISTSNLKLGDYVSYTPTKTSYKTSTIMTGAPETQTINPSELNLWRVISKNQDGTVDIISENVSSTDVYFRGQTGYQNFVGYLNVLAKQYENSNQTVGSRHFGYNGQTEFITDTSKFVNPAPWTCSTGGTCSPKPDDYESSGGGDTLYTNDYNLINTVLGTRVATNPSGTAKTYWMASRYYGYYSSTNYSWYARFITTGGTYSFNFLYSYYSSSFRASSSSYALRPILTLKSGLSYSGSGTEASPYSIR